MVVHIEFQIAIRPKKMTSFVVLSHNIQNKFHQFAAEIIHFTRKNPLNIACIQDVCSSLGPEGPIEWRAEESPPRFFMNANPTVNQNRNVAIVVGDAWDIEKVEKDSQGALLAVTLHHDNMTIKVICAYMPPELDRVGKPAGTLKKGKSGERQKEALESYEIVSV